MVRKQEKTPEEIEQEFREEIGMGDWLSRTLVGFYSLFDKGKTRLCLAVLFGQTEEVERALFFHPELVDSCWDWGPHPRMTLLHCAAIALRNREMTLELLLKQGLDPKTHDGDGLAPIEYALHDAHDPRNRRVIKLLREHGAF